MLKLLLSFSLAALLIPALSLAYEPYENQPQQGGYCPHITQNLKRGDRDANTQGQVTELQKFLVDYYDLDSGTYVTGYFGRLTQQNVIRFQREQNLPAFGYVGSLTRAAIARVCGQTTPPPPPPISFSASPTSGTAPLHVVFRASVQWSNIYGVDFGDGTNSPLQNNCPGRPVGACGQPTAEHTYSTPGSYTTLLYRRGDPAEIVGTATITVTTGTTQDISFTATPTSGTAPLNVTFYASGQIGTYSVDYGDGSSAGQMQPNCNVVSNCYSYVSSHTYTTAGTYTAILTQLGLPLCASCSPPVRGTATVTVSGFGNRQFPDIVQRINRDGSANVIVSVAYTGPAFPANGTAAEQAAAKDAVKQAIQKVLNTLTYADFTYGGQFEITPGFYGSLKASGYEKLRINSSVTNIQLNDPDPLPNCNTGPC